MRIRIVRPPLPPPDPADGIEAGRVFTVLGMYAAGTDFSGYWVVGDAGRVLMLYPQDVQVVDDPV